MLARVYTGVERSPVCAIAGDIPYRGGACPLAQEFFATMRDVYIILCSLPEDATADDTADGRPATKAAARARLGRIFFSQLVSMLFAIGYSKVRSTITEVSVR